MVDAIPEVVPAQTTLSEARSAFNELCSMKRMGLTLRDKLVQLLPNALECVKAHVPTTPLLEEASSTAGSGDTERGAQAILRAVSALKIGNFSSREVPQSVLVALRDLLCAHEGSLTSRDTPPSSPHSEEQRKRGRVPKEMQEAFCAVIGTREDPRCSEVLHQCLTHTGFSAATWLTPGVKEAVRNAVGTRPDAVYYAKLLCESPPDSRLTALESEGVRLGVWALLCKLGVVLLSFQLKHENAYVPAETLVKLMLDDVSDRSNQPIVSFLAGHTRALSVITGAQTKVMHPRPFPGLVIPLKGANMKKTWHFPNAPAGTCRHCGKRGHRISDCRVPETSVLRSLNRDKGKTRPGTKSQNLVQL